MTTTQDAATEQPTKIHLDYDQAKAALVAAMETNPRNKAMCKYVTDGQPQCIVGKALDLLGVDVVGWVETSARDGYPVNGVSWGMMSDDQRPVVMDAQASALWSVAQGRQDGGFDWRTAVTDAVAVARPR